MSMIVPKSLLSDEQKTFLKICCTYAYDPTDKHRMKYKEKLDTLVNIDPVAIKFAQQAFFQERSEMMKKYLGRKAYDYHDNPTDDKPPILFYVCLPNGDFILPYALSRIILKKNLNFERSFPKIDLKFTGQLREDQPGFCKTMISHLESSGTTTMAVCTGEGKTAMGAYLSCWGELITCVLISIKPLIKQWVSTFETFTTARLADSSIWVVSDEQPEDINKVKVLICMEERMSKINPLLVNRIGTVIIDEAHRFCVPSMIGCWLFFQPRYLIVETATVERVDDQMERVIYAAAGLWNVFKKSTKVFPVIKIETKIKGVRSSGKRGINYTKLIQSILYEENNIIDKLILEILRQNPGKKTLILTKETKHINNMVEYLGNLGIKSSPFYGDMETYEGSKILIGTAGKIGTGFDEATFDENFDGTKLEVMVFCNTVRKFDTLQQNVGRIRHDAPIIYIMVHDDPIFKDHWRLMSWWFENYTSAKVIV